MKLFFCDCFSDDVYHNDNGVDHVIKGTGYAFTVYGKSKLVHSDKRLNSKYCKNICMAAEAKCQIFYARQSDRLLHAC